MIILAVLAWIIVPLALVIYAVRAVLRVRRGELDDQDEHWYLWPFSTSADAVGQFLLAIGLSLSGVAIELTMRHFGTDTRPVFVLLAITVAAGALAWWQRAPLLVLFTVLFSFGWWTVSVQRWTDGAGATTGLAVGVGVVALALAATGVGRLLEAVPANKRLGFFAWFPGTLTIVAALFVLSSQAGILALGSSHLTSPFAVSWKLTATLSLLFAAAAAVVAAARWARATSLTETAALGVILAVMLVLSVWPPTNTSSGETSDFFGIGGPATLTTAGTVWAAVFNALLLLVLLGLVFLGYERREDWLVTFGALLLFVFVLFKYFDWLFSLFDRSIAFVGAGLLFLGVGWLMERGRRSILRAMEADDGSS